MPSRSRKLPEGKLHEGENKMRFEIHPDRIFYIGVPAGIRTPVTGVKGRCPRPLDDGDGNIHADIHVRKATAWNRCL